MSAMQAACESLSDGLSRLHSQWLFVSAVWNDDRHHRFETQYWQDYEPAVRSALEQMQNIGQLIDQAQRELD